MVLSADTLKESLKRELKVARVEAEEADTRLLLLVAFFAELRRQPRHDLDGLDTKLWWTLCRKRSWSSSQR